MLTPASLLKTWKNLRALVNSASLVLHSAKGKEQVTSDCSGINLKITLELSVFLLFGFSPSESDSLSGSYFSISELHMSGSDNSDEDSSVSGFDAFVDEAFEPFRWLRGVDMFVPEDDWVFEGTEEPLGLGL